MENKTNYLEEIEKRQKEFVKTKRKVIIVILFIGLAAIIAPFLFTLPSFTGIEFSNTGDIGSTIGGITAPFFALIAAILIYFSFDAQVQMNIEQQKQIIHQQKKMDDFEKEKESRDQLNEYSTLCRIQAKLKTQVLEYLNPIKYGYVEPVIEGERGYYIQISFYDALSELASLNSFLIPLEKMEKLILSEKLTMQEVGIYYLDNMCDLNIISNKLTYLLKFTLPDFKKKSYDTYESEEIEEVQEMITKLNRKMNFFDEFYNSTKIT